MHRDREQLIEIIIYGEKVIGDAGFANYFWEKSESMYLTEKWRNFRCINEELNLIVLEVESKSKIQIMLV